MTSRTVLLTGATGGIGRSTAQALIAAGHRVILNGRHEAALQALAAALGTQAEYITADITHAEDRARIARMARDKGVNTVINNAGISHFGLLDDCNAIESQITTNLLAPILLTQTLLPAFKALPEARIINIGSTLGSIGYPGYAAYCASKFGLRGFTEALARELADTAIRVQYIAPRATDTDINSAAVRALNAELGSQTDSPEAVAAIIVDALASGAACTYIGWPEKLFVRMNALLPNIVAGSLKKQLPIIKRHARP